MTRFQRFSDWWRRFGRVAKRSAVALVAHWRPRGDSRELMVERFFAEMNVRLAIRSDPEEREALIRVAETEWESVLGLAPGTIRRRLS